MPAPRTPTVMVLAAGEGRRLRPLTERVPKPLVAVGGEPLLARTLAWLERLGFARAVINLHHLGEEIRAYLAARPPVHHLELRYSDERDVPAPLGTGGGIRRACTLWEAPAAWIWNGDVVADLDLAELDQRLPDLERPLLVVRAHPDAERLGPLYVHWEDEQVGQLVGILDSGRTSGTAWQFTGVQRLPYRLAQRLPEHGCVVRDGYRHWLAAGETILVWRHTGYWNEIGTPERLEAVRDTFAAGELPWLADERFTPPSLPRSPGLP